MAFTPMNQPDRLRIIYLAVALGLATAAFIIIKTGRDALFFQGKGIVQLPVAALTLAAASLPLALLFVKAMKLCGARPARVGVLIFGATTLALVAPFLEPGGSRLLFYTYIFIPSTFGLIFASLWLLASDVLENLPKSETPRAFSKISASSLTGGMIGGLCAKGLGLGLPPQGLILSGALVILTVIGLVVRIHRLFPTNIVPTKNAGSRPRGMFAPIANPYAITLMLISMTGALAGLLIEVQFYISAGTASMSSKGNANFFANFYIMLNLSSLLLQLYATPKIQEKIGIRGGLMVLPFALIGSASFATAAATAFSLSVLRVTEGGLRSSVHRSIWEQAFIPIESGDRSTVKIAADGVAARVAEGLAAIGLYFWVLNVAPDGIVSGPLDTRWMAWLTLLTVITALFIIQTLKRQSWQETAPSQPAAPVPEIVCERFPDQCPCATELGKGVA